MGNQTLAEANMIKDSEKVVEKFFHDTKKRWRKLYVVSLPRDMLAKDVTRFNFQRFAA